MSIYNDPVGKTIKSIDDDNDLVFVVVDGENEYRYGVQHFQDCCESVSLVSTDGDLHDAVGKVITAWDEWSDDLEDASESGTRSVFTIEYRDDEGDTKTLRFEWHGYSNGYYGEGVSFFQYTADGNYSRW